MLLLENLHVLCIIAIFYIKSFLKLGLFLIFFETSWFIWYIEDLRQSYWRLPDMEFRFFQDAYNMFGRYSIFHQWMLQLRGGNLIFFIVK